MKLRLRNKARLATRRASAAVRATAHAQLTTQQKLDKLDRAFGPGVGAQRERARLTKALASPPKAPPVAEVAQEIFAEKPQGGAKKRGAKAGRGNKASA